MVRNERRWASESNEETFLIRPRQQTWQAHDDIEVKLAHPPRRMIAHVADKLCLQLCMHTLFAPYFTGTPLNILPVAPLYALVSVLALATKVSNIAANLRTQEQLSEQRITKPTMPKAGRTAHGLIYYIC